MGLHISMRLISELDELLGTEELAELEIVESTDESESTNSTGNAAI